MTVVFDSNTWVSALQFGAYKNGGLSTPLLALMHAAASDRIAMCDEIRSEIFDTLTGKFKWETAEANITLDAWLDGGLRVTISGDFRACRDPDDDKVLECAMKSDAALIVSGDNDLRVLDPFERIRIVTAWEYLHASWER